MSGYHHTVVVLGATALTVVAVIAFTAVFAPRVIRVFIGSYRLNSGFCPCCRSSPPRPLCPVCRGSYNYGRRDHGTGSHLTPERAQRWRRRWVLHDYPTTPPPHGLRPDGTTGDPED